MVAAFLCWMSIALNYDLLLYMGLGLIALKLIFLPLGYRYLKGGIGLQEKYSLNVVGYVIYLAMGIGWHYYSHGNFGISMIAALIPYTIWQCFNVVRYTTTIVEGFNNEIST